MGITENNHYVNQSYLKRFGRDGDGKVWAYRTLVPKETFPQWKDYSAGAIARFRHLYTRVDTGADNDELERWFNKEIETPAHPVIETAVNGGRITKENWRTLIRFIAAQDVRTPAYLIQHMHQSESLVPGVLDGVLKDLPNAIRDPEQHRPQESSVGIFGDYPFPMRVRVQDSGSEGTLVQVDVWAGRSMWLHDLRRLLTSTWKVLLEHRWTILEAAPGLAWTTSDNPVMKLNFMGPNSYNFGGGWNSRGTEIMMPLSCQHILYTRIGGHRLQRGHVLTREQTILIKQLAAKHAHRYIYASEPDAIAMNARPRTVDAIAYAAEEHAMASFHENQTNHELEMLTRPTNIVTQAG